MNYLGYVSQAFKFLGQGFSFTVGKIVFPIAYWEIIALIFLIFLLVISMAQLRRHAMDWGVKGVGLGVLFGFILALTLEGFLITTGKTALINLLGVKNVPMPLQTALDGGKKQLLQVLGATTPDTSSTQNIMSSLQSASPAEIKKIKSLLCQP